MIEQLIRQYRSKGVFVDSNILLLFFVGSFDRTLITRFKRTSQYSVDDYDILIWLLSRFDSVVTTSNILAEVNSLSGQLGEPARTKYFAHFAAKISLLTEQYVASAEAVQVLEFPRIGLTDSGIVRLVGGKYLVVTDDLKLHSVLGTHGIDSINFNHLRPLI